MTVNLSRLAKLGIVKEVIPGTYPASINMWLPFDKAEFIDMYTPIKDQSYRANDTVVQGIYQGVVEGQWSIDLNAYPDITGHVLRGIIGPDTVTPGVSTTFAASSVAGATSVSATATVPTGSTVQLQDTGGANTEYVVTGAPTGSGPYTIPIVTPATGTRFAHTITTSTIIAASSHSFKQNPAAARPTYSLLVWDTVNWSSYSYASFSDVSIKIDPKAAVTLSTKLVSFAGVPATTQSPTFTGTQPVLGWEWAQTNAGGASTRGLTLDYSIKRATEAVHSSDGIQGPREVFSGAIEADGTLKAVFENTTDMALYTGNTQLPAVATLTQPVTLGGSGSVLTLTMSQSGWTTGKRDFSPAYVQADFSLSGIYNATDGGAISATLTNFVSSAY
jgi:hypothetical protein